MGLLSRLEAPTGTKGGLLVPVGGSNRDKRLRRPFIPGEVSTRDKSYIQHLLISTAHFLSLSHQSLLLPPRSLRLLYSFLSVIHPLSFLPPAPSPYLHRPLLDLGASIPFSHFSPLPQLLFQGARRPPPCLHAAAAALTTASKGR